MTVVLLLLYSGYSHQQPEPTLNFSDSEEDSGVRSNDSTNEFWFPGTKGGGHPVASLPSRPVQDFQVQF